MDTNSTIERSVFVRDVILENKNAVSFSEVKRLCALELVRVDDEIISNIDFDCCGKNELTIGRNKQIRIDLKDYFGS